MDSGVFVLIYLIVSMMVCLSCLYLAIFRKKKHLILFTLAFFCFCISGIVLALQNSANIVLSVLFGNLFTCFAVLLLHASFRSFFGGRPLFPVRFVIYLIALAALCIFTTVIRYNLIVRSAGLGLFYTWMFLDLLLYLRTQISVLEKKVHILICASVIANTLSYMIRVALVILLMNPDAARFSGGILNNYVLSSYIVTSLLWFESMILLDDSDLMDKMKRSEEKYRLLAESASDVIWVLNLPRRELTYISPSIKAQRGYSPEEIMCMPIEEMLTEESYRALQEEIRTLLHEKTENQISRQPRYVEILQLCKNGEPLWSEVSLRYRQNRANETEIIGISRNINERKLEEEKIEYLNTHDPVTGLLNLNALRAMYAERDPSCCDGLSVIFMDIDNFRVINDSLGHTAGDRMIAELGAKLKTCVAERGMVFRSNGDEFIVVAETDDLNKIRHIAEEIKQAVSAEIQVDNRKFFLTSSIGVCAGKCHENFEQAVKNADTAMFISKKTKNTVTFYTSSFNHTKTREMIIEEDIRSAEDNRELILHYQPIIDLRTGKTAQAEALLRWKHPELGLIPPGDFIALAENTKMIIPITDWIIEEICDQINRWRSAGLSPFAVGINLSAVYIENCGDQLPEKISEILRRKNLEPSAIHFEITESSVIQNIDTVRSVFTELHRRGIHLALDDFGTGYSSLGYVKDLPLSILKLDRMFIQMIDQDEKQQTIVRGMVGIAHGLGMQVVAEGVETPQQVKMLKNFRCDYIQGYYFSRPIESHTFENYLRSEDATQKLRRLSSGYLSE